MFRSMMSPRTPSRHAADTSVVPEVGKPLKLVSQDSSGRFIIDPEAVAALKAVKGPLAVVSVCGRARQGKSYILNQLLGRSNGFVIGPTHKPCTKGLWMWSVPVKRTSSDGSHYHLLLLDTEGIEAYDQTGQYSTQIFSLAVLLSSLFVFNQMGGIDEAALDNLALVTEMTKHIRVKAGGGSSDLTTAKELGGFSPSFLWLLRDFYLDLTEEGRSITPGDYLEQALQPMAGNSKAVLAKNEIRESIRALFPDRECFALVRPLNNERELQRLDQVPLERLRPEFRHGLERLTRVVFEKAKPKRMGSAVLTGPILAALTQSYLDAINAGAVPSIATSWQSVEEQQCRLAMDAGLQAYNGSFKGSDSADEVELRERHRHATSASLEAFNNEAIGTGTVRNEYAVKLKEALEKQFEEHWKRVQMESELRCAQKLSSMEAKINAYVAQSDSANWQEAVQILEDLIKDYSKTTSGPAKWSRVSTFLVDSVKGPLSALVTRMSQVAARQTSELSSRVAALDSQLAETREQLKVVRADCATWRSKAESSSASESIQQKRADALDRKLATLEARAQARSQESADLISKIRTLEDAARSASELSRKERESIAESLRIAQTEARARHAEAADWRKKYEVAVRGHEQGKEMVEREREREKKESEEKFHAQLKRKEAEMEALKKQHREDVGRMAQVEADVRDRDSEFQTLKSALTASRAEIRELHGRATSAEARAHSTEESLAALRTTLEGQRGEMHRMLNQASESQGATSAAEARARQAEEVAERLTQQAELAAMRAAEQERIILELRREVQETVQARISLDSAASTRLEALEKENSVVRTEKAELEAELGQVRAELEAELAMVRAELEAELAKVSAELETSRIRPEKSKKRARVEEDEGEMFEEAGADFGLEGAPEGSGKAAEKVNPKVLTKLELKDKITAAGFGHLVLGIRNPTKAQLVDIYEKNVGV